LGAMIYLALLFRVESENRALREAQKAGGEVMHVTLALRWWVLPLIGVAAFTIGSGLSQRLSRYRKAR